MSEDKYSNLQNVLKTKYSKLKMHEDKMFKGQNVQRTNITKDKMFKGQNVRRTNYSQMKMDVRTKCC